MLGFATGLIMAQSREAAVDVVLPAILTFLSGILVYMIGAKGLRTQAGASAMVFCFALSLLVGSQYGAWLRFEHDSKQADVSYLIAREAALEQGHHNLAIRRLANASEIQSFISAYAEQKKLDPVRLYEAVYGNKPLP